VDRSDGNQSGDGADDRLEAEQVGALIAGIGWGITGPDAKGEGQKVAVSYDEPPGPWTYHLHGQLLDGRPAITSLTIDQLNPANPVAITRQALRGAPIGILQERVHRGLQAELENRASEILSLARTIRPKAGRSRTSEHYQQVAWWYLHAQATGRPPRKAISDHWGVSRVTASRWLAETRKRGYLPKYKPVRKQDLPDGHSYAETTRRVEEEIFWRVLGEYGSADDRWRRAVRALLAVLTEDESAGEEPTTDDVASATPDV
jgi:hypothetical protein